MSLVSDEGCGAGCSMRFVAILRRNGWSSDLIVSSLRLGWSPSNLTDKWATAGSPPTDTAYRVHTACHFDYFVLYLFLSHLKQIASNSICF